VYDRITARIGEREVALITGEERRVPAAPRFFVCTVEAMPVQRPVDFLAVDEIQLGGDRTRGHVFTDRLLRARGRRRTLWMGSDTIEPLLRALVPGVRIERYGRYSSLRHVGPGKLAALPPRTAVVAFTMADVYALAEQVRRRHGGTALVLGALSPRTRNAQVAMYQAGEVQFMVATDAIGMGLNLDLDRVAFSALHKWDGVEQRRLRDAEVGQIAGRAGRYRRDGAFGSLERVGPLPGPLVASVVSHRYSALRQLFWREPDLDLSSLDGLLASLRRPAPRRELRTATGAADLDALASLADDDGIRDRVSGRSELELLWRVCRIPDYRRSWDRDHAELVGSTFTALLDGGGRLASDWLEERLRAIDRPAGDAEVLMARLAQIRTWTYVAHRGGWIEDEGHWQERTRAIENRLSDALHERLTSRYVDRRAMLILGGDAGDEGRRPRIGEGGAVHSGGQVLGHLRGFEFRPAAGLLDDDPRARGRAIRRLLAPALDDRVTQLVEAGDDALSLDEAARVLWNGAPLARLAAGPDPRTPRLQLARLDMLGAGARSRIERRLEAWIRDRVGHLLVPLGEREALPPLARGVTYAVEAGLGTVTRTEVAPQLRELSGADRKALARVGIRLGASHVYAERLLDPERLVLRATLAAVHLGVAEAPLPDQPGTAILPARPDLPGALYRAMGYPRFGALAVRVDLLERLAALARRRSKSGSFPLPGEATVWLECSRAELGELLEALGFQRRQDDRGRWRFFRRRQRRGR
ncbi:MAG: helicase-related protein, partial [Myxococcota bacterium]|nr:helicase-related protein [Myxococcota bacterium]